MRLTIGSLLMLGIVPWALYRFTSELRATAGFLAGFYCAIWTFVVIAYVIYPKTTGETEDQLSLVAGLLGTVAAGFWGTIFAVGPSSTRNQPSEP